ncbi:MAG: MoaD/ThiS family protein [Candidatus Nanohaloarchaea archaeon]
MSFEVKLVRDDLDEEVREEVRVEEGLTVQEFLEDQGIPVEEVLVSRNGTVISSRHRLEEGDTIEVFDVIAGG